MERKKEKELIIEVLYQLKLSFIKKGYSIRKWNAIINDANKRMEKELSKIKK